MLSFKNRKIGKKQAFLAGSILAVVCLLTYYFVYYPGSQDGYPLLPQETQVAKQDNKIKISGNTNIKQRIQYLKCKDEEVITTKPAEHIIGLNYQEMQKVYSGWTIDKFDDLEVEMTLKVDSFCREHANNMFLSIKDGYVAVYYGKPGARAVLKEVTAIPVKHIMPQDIEELKRGLVVNSREELLRTLEGMQAR
ncbi:BofC C-terminal domain-containing protein|uniref:BofC C-terminal domain-containing protein n=1 Tax=Dendrosporobacter quercicolus TaxID=146817 RepID=A0A1G9KNH9_9FIRM|nr:BofC C-terminal domain-containing protein [Dendrosporobacter quercicolus]NSL46460.1 BofC C-terminal domain-containing protein [Dendrosporobacter quercicolus DSM 1736]SDL51262.1 BofC C-terminal domain-containing protein [Dendrosporobacter quercicolus]